MAELEKTSGRAVKIDPHAAQQAMLFPETSPLLEELKDVDVNALSPIEALNKLFEWQKKLTKKQVFVGYTKKRCMTNKNCKWLHVGRYPYG
jgi:hypothetical protein